MSRPEIPAYSPESILIVCLSRPTTPEAHDQLALAVDDAVSAQLHSHNKITHLLRCGDGKWQARLEDQHKDGENEKFNLKDFHRLNDTQHQIPRFLSQCLGPGRRDGAGWQL